MLHKYTASQILRFWAKVDKSGGPDACWNWTACKYPWGYGSFRLNNKNKPAHRIAWELTNGNIPINLKVCHHCDTPACCNPSHLFLGTDADNAKDRANKGRNAPQSGETGHNSKLTWRDVNEIRNLYASGNILQRELAEKYGVKQVAISRIIRNQSWKKLE